MPKILPHIAIYLRAKLKCALIHQLCRYMASPKLFLETAPYTEILHHHHQYRKTSPTEKLYFYSYPTLNNFFCDIVLVPKSRAPFSRVPQMNPSKQNSQAVDGCLQPLTDLRLEEFGKGSMEPGKKYRQFLAGVLGTGLDLQEGFRPFYCSTTIVR